MIVQPQHRRPFRGHVLISKPSVASQQIGIFPAFIPSTAVVYTPALISTTADMQLFIAGVQQEWMASTMNIDLILGAKGKASFSLYSTTTYRPAVYDEVIFYRKGIRRFGGLVQSVEDDLIPMVNAHIMRVTCTDYMGYLDRVIIAKLYTIPIGSLAWIIIFDIIQVYLKQFGITFAGFAGAGAGVGEILFHYVTAAAAIAQLVSADPSTFLWIDAFKQLHFAVAGAAAPPGLGSSPYSLTDTSGNYYDFKVTPDGTLYRNRQWVLPSVNVLSLRTETFVGDGVTTGFFTLYILTNTPLVTVDGVRQIVATLGGPYPTGWQWYWIPNGQGVFQRPGNSPLTGANTLAVVYPNPFALAVSAQNDAEIAARGLVEAIAKPQNVIDVATANAMAAGLLAAYCPNPPETITFTTTEDDAKTGQYASGEDGRWLTPGMTISITKTIPAASGTYTIQEVQSQEEGLTVFRHTIIARKNTGALDTQTGAAQLAGQALSATNNNATETAGTTLATTVVGITNPGLMTGGTGIGRYIFLYDGVISYWSILFAVTPPQGADIVVDALLNGVSIFPAGDANKIVLPAGQATEVQGYLFSSTNLKVKKGDVMTWTVIQVGSTTPGSDGQVKIVTVR